MKRFLMVTILFCLIISSFVVFSYAISPTSFLVTYSGSSISQSSTFYDNYTFALTRNGYYLNIYSRVEDIQFYAFKVNSYIYICWDNEIHNSVPTSNAVTIQVNNNTSYGIGSYGSNINSTFAIRYFSQNISSADTFYLPVFNSLAQGLEAVREYIDNPPSQYDKNANVDAFLANTLISMGFTFNTSQEALNAGSAVWDWAIDDSNITEGYMRYDVDTFVSYCNAQSNNYLNWYLGYRLHSDVTSALAHYIYSNRSLSGWNGFAFKEFDSSYSPVIRYGTGFNTNIETGANAFYPAQTITYANGAFLTSEGVNGEQLLYNPPSVRQFLGNPSAPAITENPPSNGTGIITDGNGDTVYDIDIDFPSLDWLAAALQSILDFFRQLLDTISTLISKVIDTLERLFSDAFEGLKGFGEGLIEWLYSVVESFGSIGSEYIPSDLWNIILPFIYLNIGLAIIMFVLRSH